MEQHFKKIFYLIFILIAILPFVSGVQVNGNPALNPLIPAYTYRINSAVDIKNSCYNNGTYCSDAAVCNLTVYDTNNDVIVNNQNMTYEGAYFEYLLNGTTWPQGSYKCDMVCTDGVNSGSEIFYFDITATGQGKGNFNLFVILAVASILILIIAIYMKNEYIGFISGALFILTGLFAIIYGIGDLSNLYTDSIGYVSLGLGIMFLAAAGYSAAAGSGLFSGEDGGYEDSLQSDVWGRP